MSNNSAAATSTSALPGPSLGGIKPPGPLILSPSCELAANWKLFKQKWHNYAVITNLEAKTAKYRTALFLHAIGDEALKIHIGFTFIY